MSKLYLSLVIHHHQPEGNFNNVIESAYSRSYEKFVNFLLDHPNFRVGLHYSGPLLRWFTQFHPEFIEKLKVLLGRGQIEILSGGYGESILVVWDERDQVDQLKRINDYIQDLLDTTPTGLWLTERVWEPALPSVLKDAGYRYTLLDDNHFQAAGLKMNELYGYYVTEDKGKMISVIPSSNKLRYLIPFALVDRLMSFLHSIYLPEEKRLISMGDDGEKFGLWPGTYKWVYEEGWLEKFAEEVEKNKQWLEFALPQEYLAANAPLDRVYIPTLSYFELMEWSLPSRAALEYKKIVVALKEYNKEEMPSPYIRGGFWRNFFSKYAESNYMHKRIIWLSQLFHENREKYSETEADAFLSHLYKAQCNDGFWHGVFSGLYAPHLRRSIWENILKAQKYNDDIVLLKENSMRSFTFDIDCDGHAEHICVLPEMVVAFSESGGCIAELSYKPVSMCLTSTLTRRFESYHSAIEEISKKAGDDAIKTIHHIQKVKESGLENYLVYDDYLRNNFLLHIIDKSCTLENFRSRKCTHLKGSLTNFYKVKANGIKGDRYKIQFSTMLSSPFLHIQKEFIIDKSNRIENKVLLTNNSNESLIYKCALELNLNLFIPDQPTNYYEFPSESRLMLNWEGEKEAGMMRIVDEISQIAVMLEPLSLDEHPQKWWIFPVYTISQSEDGYEKVYQGNSISLLKEITIQPLSEVLFGLSLTLKLL